MMASGWAEAAVVASPNELIGSALIAFITFKSSVSKDEGALEKTKEELKASVAKEIGPIARPDEIRFAEALPKTRSGKIMLRLLREMITTGKTCGDTSTLEDFSVS